MENVISAKVCGILTKQSKGQMLQEKNIYPRKFRKLGLWVAVWYRTKFIYFGVTVIFFGELISKSFIFFMQKKKIKEKERTNVENRFCLDKQGI